MISVVVYAQKPDRPAHLVAGMLALYGGVHLHTHGSLRVLGDETPEYFVDAVSCLDELTVPDSVLLLADQSAPRRLELGGSTIVVTGSDNRRMRRLLKGRDNPVVTCGTGVRDTVTLSSMSAERVLLCAQRELPTVTGRWLEPFEFAANIRDCSLCAAMLAAGTAAVCGCDLSRNDVSIGGR